MQAVYRALLRAHGPQQWWPHEGANEEQRAFEISLGAILTQNTAWKGAERSLQQLRAAGMREAADLLALPADVLGEMVRPSGHYNQKARRLQEFARVVVEEHGGSVIALLTGEPEVVRARVLAIWGIGPETADAITLYAGEQPTFVVDAYTIRLFERLALIPPGGDATPSRERYEAYRQYFLAHIGADIQQLNEWHALIVRHGQRVCLRSRPLCETCVLRVRCPAAGMVDASPRQRMRAVASRGRRAS